MSIDDKDVKKAKGWLRQNAVYVIGGIMILAILIYFGADGTGPGVAPDGN